MFNADVIVDAFGVWLDEQVIDLSLEHYDEVLAALADEIATRRACVREERAIEEEG